NRVPGTLFGFSGSAAVPGRIKSATDRTRVSITQIRRRNIHRLGAAKNGRAPVCARAYAAGRQEWPRS
ncbi:MAG: hypothetical protein ACP5MD_12575, partial [Verrucomicrobiia bacterium]